MISYNFFFAQCVNSEGKEGSKKRRFIWQIISIFKSRGRSGGENDKEEVIKRKEKERETQTRTPRLFHTVHVSKQKSFILVLLHLYFVLSQRMVGFWSCMLLARCFSRDVGNTFRKQFSWEVKIWNLKGEIERREKQKKWGGGRKWDGCEGKQSNPCLNKNIWNLPSRLQSSIELSRPGI